MVQVISSDAQSPTILIVEDETFVRMVSADMLAEEGFHVLEAESADEALNLLEQDHGIELLFTDIRMPGSMNGLQLAESVHRRWPAIRLLVTSGHCLMSNQELPDHGRFIPKPYRRDTILREIRRTLAQADGGSDSVS